MTIKRQDEQDFEEREVGDLPSFPFFIFSSLPFLCVTSVSSVTSSEAGGANLDLELSVLKRERRVRVSRESETLAGQTKPTEMNMLFNVLGCNTPARRDRAFRDAQELTAEQVNELAEMATQRRRSSLRLKRTKRAIGLLMVAGSLFYPANAAINGAFVSMPALLALMVCFYVGERADYRRPTRWHTENLIRLLEFRSDRRSVGALLLLLEKAKGKQRERLLRLLLRLLPEIRTEDAREWNALQREALLLVLRAWHKNTDLAHALLKAMPEIGGTWAVEAVERLATLKDWHPDRLRSQYTRVHREARPWQGRLKCDRQPKEAEAEAMVNAFQQVGIAAAECLPGLRSKITGEESAQTLLRASSAGNSAAELLRPAADKSVLPDPTNLLRPGPPPTAFEEKVLTYRN